MGFDASPQRTFGGDQYRIGSDLEGRDAERVEMGVPGGLLGLPRQCLVARPIPSRANDRVAAGDAAARPRVVIAATASSAWQRLALNWALDSGTTSAPG
jgi:hypothetical protein